MSRSSLFLLGAAGATAAALAGLVATLDHASVRPKASASKAPADAPAPAPRTLVRADAPDVAPTPATSEPPTPRASSEATGLYALANERMSVEEADARYLDALRASGAAEASWSRDAYDAVDALAQTLRASLPDAAVSAPECHAAGCTFTISSTGALEDGTAAVLDSDAMRAWPGSKAVLPVVDASGTHHQRWILVRPSRS